MATHAQQYRITQFQTSDGTITWTNPDTNFYYGIEHTTNLLDGSWSHPYTPSWWNIRSTNSQISTEVPLSVIEEDQITFFRGRSSSTPLPPEYYPLSLYKYSDPPESWRLKAGALTLTNVSRVFVTGEYIQGEHDLITTGTDPYGYQEWDSPIVGGYLLDEQPVLPTKFRIHIVSGSGTNTESIIISEYTTVGFGSGQRP